MKQEMMASRLIALLFMIIIVTSHIPGLEENISQETIIEEEIDEEVIEQTIENEEIKISIGEQSNIEEIQEGTDNKSLQEEKEVEVNSTTEEKGVDYIDIEEIQEFKKNIKEEGEEKEEKASKKITQAFYIEGKKVLEATTNEPLPEITKSEVIEDFGKTVTIASDEHVTTPLTVYVDLEKEAKEEQIIILWENKGKVAENIKYYDEDKNGLIESVSWVVPHLSTQIFKIIVDTELIEDIGATEVTIERIDAPSGLIISNPVEFAFNVTYNNVSNLNCTLNIPGASISENGFDFSISQDLPNGNYGWTYHCFDNLNTSNLDTDDDTFTISEDFSISNIKDMYIYKTWDANIHDSDNAIIDSSQSSNVVVYVDRPSSDPDTGNTTGAAPLNYAIDNSIILGGGTYELHAFFDRLEEEHHISQEFYATEITINHPTAAETGEEITIEVEINSQDTPYNIEDIIIDYGNGDSDISDFTFNGQNYDVDKTYTYASEGTYEIELLFDINGEDYTISRQTISVSQAASPEDGTDPTITLITPDDGDTISNNIVTFEFEASDNVLLDSCNFSVYNVTSSNSGLTYNANSRVYREDFLNIDETERDFEISLTDFNNREYAWEVECSDNSSNYDFEANYFTYDSGSTVTTNSNTNTNTENINYERKDEVQELIEYANSFIEQEGSWNANEKEALENIGLLEDVKFYKKRLLDIEQTLSRNLNFIEDTQLREERRKETLEEIDSIKEKMPKSFRVVENYEYVKNGNTFSWTELIGEYLEQTQTQVSSSINALAEENKELQQDVSISTVIKNIEIEYYEGKTEKFMLVNKELRISSDAKTNRILEVFPKKLLDPSTTINFSSQGEEITKNHIYEFTIENIDKNKLVYRINEQVNTRDLEEIDTILFTDQTDRRGGLSAISGYLVLGATPSGGIGWTLFAIILIIAILCLAVWVYSMMKSSKLKKNPNIYKILELIDGIKKFLKENNINDARENYKKIQEQYNVLDVAYKMKIFPLLKKAQVGIDKRDIWGLVKEYKAAKNNFQKEDATRLYEDIKKVYKRLPKKEQTRVFQELGI